MQRQAILELVVAVLAVVLAVLFGLQQRLLPTVVLSVIAAAALTLAVIFYTHSRSHPAP